MNARRRLPTIPYATFDAHMRKRPFEDVEAIRAVEGYFRKTRGYVFAMPKRGAPVILLLSGGMDSSVVWHMLMEQYNLDVYPLFVDSGKWSGAANAVSKTFRWMRKTHGDRARTPYTIRQQYFPPELENPIKRGKMDPTELLASYDRSLGRFNLTSLHGTNMFTTAAALIYMQSLRLRYRIAADTIFCGVTAEDGLYVQSQTFTFLRVAMLFLSRFYGNAGLQYASPLLEREMGTYLTKADYLPWAAAAGFPLASTYSCSNAGRRQCGVCMTCAARRHAFYVTNIPDTSPYADTSLMARLLSAIRRRIPSIHR